METEKQFDQLSPKDQELWKIAKKRVSFKKHFATYIIVNTFLWLLWYFSSEEDKGTGFPWPVWSTLGWGIGMAFSYFDAYGNTNKAAVEKEFERLKKDN